MSDRPREPAMDPREFREVLRAAKRNRLSEIRRLRTFIASLKSELDALTIAGLKIRHSLDPQNPYAAARVHATVADLLKEPTHG